jgi:hypothetical protein
VTDPDDDGWQQYKDDLAMGYINPDGTQREPDEPDGETIADYEADHAPGPGPRPDDVQPSSGEAPF